METEVISVDEPHLSKELGRTMLFAGAAAAASVVGMYVGLAVVAKFNERKAKRQAKKDSAYKK